METGFGSADNACIEGAIEGIIRAIRSLDQLANSGQRGEWLTQAVRGLNIALQNLGEHRLNEQIDGMQRLRALIGDGDA